MSRNLETQFLLVVNDQLVAVDRVQPVAALFSSSGALLDLVSWVGLARPPDEWVWPNRRVAIDEGSVLVQDLPGGLPVSLDVGVGGFQGLELVGDVDVPWRHSRLFSAAPRTSGDWVFDVQRKGDRWSSWVGHGDQKWDAGGGSIVARATSATSAMVAIRRAPVRPWEFRPKHDLVVLTAESNSLVPTYVPPVDIAGHSWTRLPGSGRAFDEYLPWSNNLANVIEKNGGSDVQLSSDGWNVDIYFTRNGKNYLLHDEPLDELGRAVGLRFWGTGVDDWSAVPTSLMME